MTQEDFQKHEGAKENTMSLETLLIIVAVVLFVVVFWAIATANRFRVKLVKIREADSGIDVALTRRYDLLTKMIESVKGYMQHESELFSKIVKLRTGATSMSEKSQCNREMNELFQKLNVVVENYPQLKASENFQELQRAIADTEQHLQAARRLYNSNVSIYNQAIVVFPASIVAGKKYTAREFFIADEHKRQDVEIKF